jgi:hypothetical protein
MDMRVVREAFYVDTRKSMGARSSPITPTCIFELSDQDLILSASSIIHELGCYLANQNRSMWNDTNIQLSHLDFTASQ